MASSNKKRAARAEEALQSYIEARGEVFENSDSEVADLIADLYHLAHAQGHDIARIRRLALLHFDAERRDPDENDGDAMATGGEFVTGEKVPVGHISIDSGRCWIGDPCYVMSSANMPVKMDYHRYLDEIKDAGFPLAKSFNHELGHEGKGCAVTTGWGDGLYQVYAVLGEEGRVARVIVEFMDDGDA